MSHLDRRILSGLFAVFTLVALDARAQQQPDASTAAAIPDAVTASPASDEPNATEPRAVVDAHLDDRPAPISTMSDDEKWRFNLNQAGHYLRHIPRAPITTYLHPSINYMPDEWDEIGTFLKTLAAAMRNAVAALDEANKDEESGPMVKATTGPE